MAGEIFLSTIGQWDIEPEHDVFGRRVISPQVRLVQMPAIGQAQVFIADFETADNLAGIGTFDLSILLPYVRIPGCGHGRNPK